MGDEPSYIFKTRTQCRKHQQNKFSPQQSDIVRQDNQRITYRVRMLESEATLFPLTECDASVAEHRRAFIGLRPHTRPIQTKNKFAFVRQAKRMQSGLNLGTQLLNSATSIDKSMRQVTKQLTN